MKYLKRQEYFLICLILIFVFTETFVYKPVFAQENTKPDSLFPPGVEMFELRYVSVQNFIETLKVLDIKYKKFHFIESKVFISFEDQAEAIRAKQLLQKIDIEPKQINIRVSLVLALDEPSKESPQIENNILAQLKKTLRFQGYQLITSGFLIIKSGEKGLIPLDNKPAAENKPERYDARIEAIFINDGRGIIRLEGFGIVRYDGQMTRTLIHTSLNIKNGDTVIVGSSNINGQVYISVITAQVMN